MRAALTGFGPSPSVSAQLKNIRRMLRCVWTVACEDLRVLRMESTASHELHAGVLPNRSKDSILLQRSQTHFHVINCSYSSKIWTLTSDEHLIFRESHHHRNSLTSDRL